ncbi:alpha/beta hydrolase [Terrarubrum flagellatum]|uniref:alpha/beta fold hydrolase n=1 Tax=Terrirubrum flagellatum TaxID=2895980 RepID=UPI0031455D68
MAISGSVARPFGSLAYEDNGVGAALIFAHGLGGNHLSWWQQIAHYKPHFRCVTFSHRGFAPSSSISGGPDPYDYADDLAALLDHLAIPRAVIIAQSMGGWSAVEFGLKYPDRVAGIVFACTTGSIDFEQAPHMKLGAVAEWRAFADAEIAAGQAESVHPACGRRMASENPALHELYKEIDRMNAGLDKPAIMRKLHAMRARPPSDLDQIPAHLMFITGGEDIVIPPCGVEAVSRSVANARFARVEDAGHSVYFERASRFNDALDSYLGAINYR